MPSDCAAASCVHGVVHPPCSQTLTHWLFWVLLGVIIITAIWSAMYLNKAMMVFGNTETIPVYYCTFTIASIIGGALIYDELAGIGALRGVGFGCGIFLAFSGVALLMSGRGRRVAKKGSRIETVDAGDGDGDDAAAEEGRPPSALSPSRLARALTALENSPAKILNSLDALGEPVLGSRPGSPSSRRHQPGGMPTVEISFRELHNEEKLDALVDDNQKSVVDSVVVGGPFLFAQASSSSLLASDRKEALLQVQSANYPGSLVEARRLHRKRRLDERTLLSALGERAVNAFSALLMREEKSRTGKQGDGKGGEGEGGGPPGPGEVSAASHAAQQIELAGEEPATPAAAPATPAAAPGAVVSVAVE
jgi:hypothetical protein